MRKLNKTVSKILFSGILLSLALLVGSCENWMSNDNFMEKIESEVHDANASQVNVYVRYAKTDMGTTEPSGSTTMKIDVASKISAITGEAYGFVKWAAFRTSDFPTNKQHSNLVFITEDNYNENFKKYELSDSIVHFSNPKNPSTEVKILSAKDDIFIIPIVAERPKIENSDPKNGKENQVTNKSIRILFSKPIDKKSLYDDERNPNFSITTANAIFTDDENEMKVKDITDRFDVTLSETGQLLTLKLKAITDKENNIISQELFEIRQTITVTLFEGIRDTYGFSMNGNSEFSFETGTSADSLAPMIEVLFGGTGEECNVFVTFGEDGKVEGAATTAAKNANKESIESDEYTDLVVAQRVYDKINIFVKANDIIASGNTSINAATDLSETNVASIGIAASLYFDKDGKALVLNDDAKIISDQRFVYIPGKIASNAQITKLFNEVVPTYIDKNTGEESKYTSGTIYTYDISSLPDGLIRIDVWGIDMTGNSGGPKDKGAPYYEKHDNGFKSIFVVKDTTPIDSEDVKAKKKVISNSTQAPYYWYNEATLNSMELFDSPENKIQDAGHPKLRSLDKNLWWTFKVGDVKETVKKDDSSWRRIHDEETGETSIAYPLSDAQAPSKDGPVDITLYLKDDLGNLSEPVLLDSIMYDETKPTITLKKGKGDFINAKGEPVQNNSKSNALGQILKVDFTEDNAESNVDAVSGIRQLEINIEKDGVKVPAPRTDAFKVLYVPSTVVNPTPETTAAEGLREIPIATDDSYNSNNLVVFDVDDSTKITSGTFFIYGLTLGDTDGPWTISVNLYDSALNPARKVATTIMMRDTTPPAIDKIYVNDAIKREVYNDTSKDSWWMPSSRLNSDGFYTVTFDIYVNETGSGLKYIKLPENVDINFTDNTKLSANGLILSDYSFDEETNTITMLDEFEPKFINIETEGDKIHFALEDVQLKVNDSAAGNRAGIEVEDFVDNITKNTTLTYSDNSTGTLIFTDTKAPEIAEKSLRIEDSAKKSNEDNPENIGYNNQYTDENDESIKYTDEQNVTLLLTLEPETVSGSGVKTVHLSENADFTFGTKVYVDNVELTSGWQLTEGNKAITFEKVFIDANKLKFTNVKLESTTNGEQFIHAYLTDFAGLNTEVSKKSVGIIYDDKAPEITNTKWVASIADVAEGSAQSNEVTDQQFKVEFTEATAGAKVIKLDITYENEEDSYSMPFGMTDFKLHYNDTIETLTKVTDYTINENGRYIVLTEPRKSGYFSFENLKLAAGNKQNEDGIYKIKVTMLDAAENIHTSNNSIFIDTTDPVIQKVQILDVIPRTVYGDSTNTTTWWIPHEKYVTDKHHDINLKIKVNEKGSGLQFIRLSKDIELTNQTQLKKIINGQEVKLFENTDYICENKSTIKLLNYKEPELRNVAENSNNNEPFEFKLEHVRLSKDNTSAEENANQIALKVDDFVKRSGENKLTNGDYKVYYSDDDNTNGTLVYADSIKPEIEPNTLKIADSKPNEYGTNPDNIGYDETYTDSKLITLTLKLKPESVNNGSGVKIVHLSDNAEFTISGESITKISVNGTELTSGFDFASDNKSVTFEKVFTEDQTLTFTNVKLLSDVNGKQKIETYLTDFVGIEADKKNSNEIVYDNKAPVITNMAWSAANNAIAIGHSNTKDITNQTLIVDFIETVSGTKVIKFDIDHEGTGSYSTPFAHTDFKLEYGETELIKGTDYTINENGRYIILTEPKKSGNFKFSNLQINDTNAEGRYNIKVTLLDAAENINPQGSGDKYSWPISVDRTAPAFQLVQILGAESRTDYSNPSAGVTWWMPASKFDPTGKLNKVALKLVIKEAGSGLRNIKLSQDVQFTSATKLIKIVGETETTLSAGEGHDYILHTDTNTIELLDHQNPILKGTETEFVVIKLENVQLNNIDASAGNKIAVELEDFVYLKKDNETGTNTGNYTITYPDTTTGTLVYADYTAPVISELRIEDSKQEQNVNPDTKGVNQTLYTNDQNVNLVLTLGAESTSSVYGSGVKIISLTNNATFTTTGTDTEITKIFVDDVELSASDYTLNSTNVNFGNKVFTAANVIKFTNVNILNGDDKTNQTIKAQLTDFVGLSSAVKADDIIFDTTPADITSISWVAPSGVAKGSANTNEVTDQTLKIEFTEETAGVKVIKFDVTYDGDAVDADSYDAPFSMTNFKLYYAVDDAELAPLTRGTDYTIEDGRYIVLNTPKLTGSFNFENLKLRNASAEGEYNIMVTLLDAAENINWNENTATSKYNKKIFIDTTAPVVEKVLVEDAQNREVYNDVSNAKKWWMPSSKFDGEGELSKVSLQITVNEVGSGLKIIKLSQDVEFTSKSKLKKGTEYLAPGTEYTLDTTNNTITLLNYENPKLRGSANDPAVVFTLENVKLNNINDAAGNKVGVTVEDFVTNPGSNRIGQTENYKIYYPDESDGTLIFADSENPEILDLDIEDASHNAVTNPDNKAWDKDNYTDSQDVTLILTLAAEDTDAGSGVKVITLTDNAEFTTTGTDAEITKIFVDGTELTTGYDFDSYKKSVTFEKVFIAENIIKFTNVKLPATEGTYSVKANLKDFTGWNATTDSTSNPIMLDTSAPAISEIKWMRDDTTVTEGTTNTAVVANQSLNVAFTEAVSGVKVIKFDITSDNDNNNTSYATPFDAANFTLKCGTTELTDYTIDGKYIILNNTEKTNNFNFHDIKIADTADECVYTIKVTLLDAAENNVIDTKTISIDVTNPEIDGNLRIHDLIRSVELTTDSTVTEKYWLPKAYINASVTTGQAPASIPVYLTIKERTSGIKIFEFSEDVVLNKENTKLYKIDSNAADETASAARTLIPVTSYDIDNDAHTITIRNEVFAKENFAKKNDSNEEEPFIILVDNIGFAHADSSSEVSENSITITLFDVAKNVSNTASTSQTNIYSDSIAPAEPQNLILVDRKNTSEEIAASTGYTNESIVDMKFNLLASEQFGSGYHKFVISGATFKSTDDVTYATDATKVTMTVGSGSSAQVIQNLSFEISDEGHTLTLKKSGTTADAMAVIRKAVNVEIKNIHLDNPDVEDEGASDKHTVTLKAYDLAGWDSSASTANIKLDKSAPELAEDSNGKKGPFVANYTKTTYYKPSINVYPHVSSSIETVHGVDVDYSGTSYPTFYTATSYAESGVSAEKFQVKLADGVSYGAVLGIRANDNVMLGGYNGSKTFLYYIADSNFSKTKAQILASGTNLAADINNNCAVGTTNDNYKSTALWFGFTSGKYSAVIVDEAGNVSDVFRFAVVTDTVKPVTSSFANRVLLKRPDESSNIYRNDSSAISTTSDFNYKAYDSGSTSSINTIKYVTKQAENKYQIILNLGDELTSSLVSKLDGTTNSTSTSTSTSTSYNELSGTYDSSPIEKYAISTWYGAWPKSSTSTDSYSPVVPYGTYFPCGTQTLAMSSSALNSDYTRDYFGYSSSFTSTWHAGEGNTSWHIFSENTSAVTDSGNSIRSYVKDNNLIIEIPNNKSTAPVSVFLQDGCGNINYVVCGLKKSGSYETAPSFIVDNMLGWAHTNDKGEIEEPFIIQAPYNEAIDRSDNEANDGSAFIWDSKTSFGFGNQSGNAESGAPKHDGVGEKQGFIKDKTKMATYYNPALSNSVKSKQYKLGLSLHFWEPGTSSSVYTAESVTFAGLEKPQKASDSDISAGKYTVRGLLYCSTSSTKPTYKTIVDCLATENARAASEKTGQVTDWTYVQASSSANEALIYLDYPCPDYDKLGWTTQESNKEPRPHYIWYLVEDRVGNYEIAKVVNSRVNDKTQTATATSTIIDRWLYDAKGPEIYTRRANSTGTKVSPSDIASTQDDVDLLVATNNGYVPYLKPGTTAGTYTNDVYVSASSNHVIRNTSLLNSNVGYGTTHYVEDANDSNTVGSKNRTYLPFMDLEVSELTGIRAFCWSTSSTAPSWENSSVLSENNTQGDNTSKKWYAGYSATNINADIGFTWDYSGEATNSYFSHTASTSSYKGKYSGTKVNTVFPSELLKNATSATTLYLHVIDWTGNVESYRMGSGLNFINDTTAPSESITDSGYANKICNVDGEYYVNSDGVNINVKIAGTGEKAVAEESITIRIPNGFFSDRGSGYKGFTLSNYDVQHANRDATNNAYLEIPFSKYNTWAHTKTSSSATNVTAYFYDNVGNQIEKTLKCYFDDTPPSIESVSFVTEAGKGTEFAHTATDEIKDETSTYGKVTDFTPRTATKHTKISDLTESEVQEIWVNKTKTSRFHINLTENISDFDDAIINKWNKDEEKWDWVTSWKIKTSSNNWNHGDINGDGEDDVDGDLTYCPNLYTLLDFASTGTYYQIDTKDLAGNHSYQYFKLYLDEEGPSLAIREDSTSTTPTIELGKGSINPVGTDDNKVYYYTAETGKELKVNFAMTDAGIKNSAQTFWYSFDNSNWKSIQGTDGITEITGKVAAGDVDMIYLKDTLGNPTTVDVNFAYTYTDAAGKSKTETIPKLCFYGDATDGSEDAPKTPTYTVNNIFHNNDTIKTRAYGTNNKFATKEIKRLNSTSDTILINTKDRIDLQISFTKPDNIIGYLVTDENGNVISQTGYESYIDEYDGSTSYRQIKLTDYVNGSASPSGNIGVYSFNSSLETSFIETLPLILKTGDLNTDRTEVKRNYYAVDVVGNISKPLVITYSYDDPNNAKDITLIESIDDVLQEDVKSAMQKDINTNKLYFTSYAKKAGTKLSGSSDNKAGKVYFNDGFIVLRCTLPAYANDDYEEKPNKVELYDVWNNGNSYLKRGSSATTSNSNYANLFKVYPSTQKDDSDRYYCYIAFKIDGNFDNNTTFGGSLIYARIYGKGQAQSDFGYLNAKGVTVVNNYGWQMDKEAPFIDSTADFYKTSDSVNKLYNFNIKEPSENGLILLDSIPKAKDNNVRTDNNQTNIYKSGSHIYFKIHYRNGYADYIRDTLSGKVYYKFVVTDPETSSNKNYNATVSASSSGWSELKQEGIINSSGVFGLVLPDVTTPNSHIALFFKDSVNNVSEPYYLGDKSDENVQWWILDRDPEKINVTVDGTTQAPEWDKNKESYDLDVSFGDNSSGVIIKSITAENASVEKVEFNNSNGDEAGDGNSNNQPTYDKTTGQFSSDYGWVNISGIKVTLKPNARAWTDQPVKLIINGISKDVFTVPANPLLSSNITIKTAEWKKDTFTYTLNVKTKNGATTANIKDIVLDTGSASATVSWSKDTTDNTKATITLSDVEGQSWTSAKNVKLLVKNHYSGDADLPMGNKLTIPKIATSDITINALAWATDGTTVSDKIGTKEFAFSITYPKKADAISEGITSSVTSDFGTLNVVSPVAGTASTRGSATLKLQVSKDWTTKTPTFSINNVSISSGLEIPAMESSDIAVTQMDGETALTSYSWNKGTNVGDDAKKKFIFKVSRPEVSGQITDVISSIGTVNTNECDLTSNPAKVSVTVAKTWSPQALTLTFKNSTSGKTLDKEIFTGTNLIPALDANDITVKQRVGEGNNQTVSDFSWNGVSFDSNGEKSFVLEFLVKGNAETITNLTADGGDISWTSGNTATLKVAKGWTTKDVTLYFNQDSNGQNGLTKKIVEGVETISGDDIAIEGADAEWSDSEKVAGVKTYELTIKTPTAIPENGHVKYGNTPLTISRIENDTKKVKVNLTATRDWAAKTISLNINGVPKNVLSVPAIDASNISITGDKEWDEAGGTKTFTLTVKTPTALPSEAKVKYGNELTFTTDDTDSTKIVVTLPLTKDWEEKAVSLDVNGITKATGITVPKIGEGDITITRNMLDAWANDARSKTYQLTLSAPTAIPSDSVTTNYGSVSFNDETQKYELTVTRNFAEKPVTLTINGVDKATGITVPKLNDQTISIRGQAWNTVTENESDRSKNIVFTLYIPDNVDEINNMSISDGTNELSASIVNHNSSAKTLTLKLYSDWEDKNLTFTIEGITLENVYTIPAIIPDDITITGETGWDNVTVGEDGYKTFELTLSAPAAIPADSVTTNCGTVTFDTETKLATLKVKEGFASTNVILTINGVNKNTGIEVPAAENKEFENGDIEVTPIASSTWSAETESYEVPITLKNGATVANLDGITLTTNVEGINATFKKSEGETPSIIEPVTIVLSGDALKTQKWTEQEVKVTIGEATVTVLIIPERNPNLSDITITSKNGGKLELPDSNTWYIPYKIKLTNGLEIAEIVPSDGKDGFEDENEDIRCIQEPSKAFTDTLTITVTIKISNTDRPNVTFVKYLFKEGGPTLTQPNGNNSNSANSAGTSAGFLSGILSRITGSNSESSNVDLSTPKTRSISIPNWVTDELNTSELAEKVSADSTAVTKKAAKKAKKAQKAAKSVKTSVGQPVVSETVEAVAITSAATLGDVVETVTETADEVITSADTTETAVIADTVEPSATMNLPVYSEPLAEEEINASDSRALIWTFIALITAALVTAGAVLFAKHRK